jgi:hypothetical protein
MHRCSMAVLDRLFPSFNESMFAQDARLRQPMSPVDVLIRVRMVRGSAGRKLCRNILLKTNREGGHRFQGRTRRSPAGAQRVLARGILQRLKKAKPAG